MICSDAVSCELCIQKVNIQIYLNLMINKPANMNHLLKSANCLNQLRTKLTIR